MCFWLVYFFYLSSRLLVSRFLSVYPLFCGLLLPVVLLCLTSTGLLRVLVFFLRAEGHGDQRWWLGGGGLWRFFRIQLLITYYYPHSMADGHFLFCLGLSFPTTLQYFIANTPTAIDLPIKGLYSVIQTRGDILSILPQVAAINTEGRSKHHGHGHIM